MIKRIVRMSFEPGQVKTFQEIFKSNWQSIRGFDGCSHVELLQDKQLPNLFFTYSHWASEEHLNAYRNSELFKKVWGATKILFNEKPQAWTLTELNFSAAQNG